MLVAQEPMELSAHTWVPDRVPYASSAEYRIVCTSVSDKASHLPKSRYIACFEREDALILPDRLAPSHGFEE